MCSLFQSNVYFIKVFNEARVKVAVGNFVFLKYIDRVQLIEILSEKGQTAHTPLFTQWIGFFIG